MFATFTDWTLDEPKTFFESAHELWPSMKEAGAEYANCSNKR